jgi:tRNA/tmRNA/rRNA uracil-C5-methylase (TrmA/RlmC/RlmD family)
MATPTPGRAGTTDEEEWLELDVGAVAAGGGCVARAPEGRVVFVRHTLPGERVLARVTATTRSYQRADAVEVLSPSPDRVAPPCPHAGPGRCGGCDYQHVELGAQRRFKAFRIAEQLARVAGLERDVEVEAVRGDTGGLRWRSRVRVAVDAGGAVGLRRHRSHEVEPVADCPVASPAVAATGALTVAWPGATELEVVTGSEPGEAVVSVTPQGRGVAHPPALDGGVGLVVRRRVVRPPGAVHAVVRGHRYRISAGVFWQAHVGAAGALLDAVLALAGDCAGARVADLYAGAGLFSVPLAVAAGPAGSVLAVERDRRACADARHNGAGLPSLRVARADVTPGFVERALGRPDLVVLDPAREGAGTAVTAALAAQAATLRRIIYVSCDPSSFARDLRVLLDAGWHLAELRAFDIFPMTEHVELVAAIDPPRP